MSVKSGGCGIVDGWALLEGTARGFSRRIRLCCQQRGVMRQSKISPGGHYVSGEGYGA